MADADIGTHQFPFERHVFEARHGRNAAHPSISARRERQTGAEKLEMTRPRVMGLRVERAFQTRRLQTIGGIEQVGFARWPVAIGFDENAPAHCVGTRFDCPRLFPQPVAHGARVGIGGGDEAGRGGVGQRFETRARSVHQRATNGSDVGLAFVEPCLDDMKRDIGATCGPLTRYARGVIAAVVTEQQNFPCARVEAPPQAIARVGEGIERPCDAAFFVARGDNDACAKVRRRWGKANKGRHKRRHFGAFKWQASRRTRIFPQTEAVNLVSSVPPLDDTELARRVCSLFNVPAPTRVEAVAGGLQHRLLRLGSGSGDEFALKLLSPRATSSEASIQRFERGEMLASLAAQSGVPAMVALRQNDGFFVARVEGQCALLFPWVEGEVLPPRAVSPARAAQMGGYLAQIHALEVRFPEQSAPSPEAFPDGHFQELARRAHAQNASWSPRLSEAVGELERLNARARAAQLSLQGDWVTGHLDFDQKNVLWRGEAPTILDWEQAKPISPALEAIGAGLSWAGQSAGAPSKDAFLAWLSGYQAQRPLRLEDLETATDGVIGKWTIWLEFNLQRLLDEGADARERQIAFDAGMHALGATLQLGADGELYRAWCREALH